jgi:predicted metal-dependent hydrolase
MGDLAGTLSYALSYIGLSRSNYPLVHVVSTVDGHTYTVRDMQDKQVAADTMAKVRLKMNKLKLHLESTVPDKQQVKQLTRNFEAQSYRFKEATPDAEHTSYSVNKGEEVHFCLRQREGGDESLVDEEIITFVAIHEMGHMITKTVGHDADFWNNFAWLLQEAEKIHIYKHRDFRAHPVSYCGMKITDQPTYDPSKDGTDLSIGVP